MVAGFQREGACSMMRNNKWTQLINFSLSAILCTHLTIAISGETVAQPIDNCTDSTGIQLGICVNTDNDSLTVLAQQQKQIESSGHPSSGGGSSTLDEQRAQKTADNTPDPRALAYEEWARCKAAAPGKGPKGSAASSTNYDDACPLPPTPQRGNDQAQDPGRQPTTQDILSSRSRRHQDAQTTHPTHQSCEAPPRPHAH